jgi:hypothetical protein
MYQPRLKSQSAASWASSLACEGTNPQHQAHNISHQHIALLFQTWNVSYCSGWRLLEFTSGMSLKVPCIKTQSPGWFFVWCYILLVGMPMWWLECDLPFWSMRSWIHAHEIMNQGIRWDLRYNGYICYRLLTAIPFMWRRNRLLFNPKLIKSTCFFPTESNLFWYQ